MESGNSIFQKRKEFTSGLIESIKKFYFEIAGRPEALELDYESQLLERGFDQLLKDSRERDLITQRSTAGIQRDEIEIKLMDQSFRAIASQGQRKSLLFAMKMAEFEILKKEKGFAPILLLDDVFEKLDEGRMSNLLNWACIRNEGQVFITDTHCQRIIREFQELGVEGQQIHL
jgi:DNA replication and repair protein RecF